MTRGFASRRLGVVHFFYGPALLSALLLGAATVLPVFGQATHPAADNSGDFGPYVVQHQETLAPFFSKNAGDFFRQAMPALLSVAGWVVFVSMVAGWGLDVLMSRAYAFFYAPALAHWKRAILYATGSLFLSFLYAALTGLVLVLLSGAAQAQILIPLAALGLLLVAVVAQIVWILYLFRTDLGISSVFYLALVIVHGVASFLITQPILGSRASPDITNFVDRVITPRLQAEAQATRQQLATVSGGRDSAQSKVTECQDEITQAESEQANLRREIEQKKNSDIYTLAQLLKARAQGDLATARQGLAGFGARFPGSPLAALARAQLSAVEAQITAADVQRKQQEADDARAEAAARADLLAKAAKGTAPLSEMRHALIGKSRAQVKDLLGPPSDTASDQWNYGQRMILNPLTGEQTGLSVYFNEGIVQTVDYHRGAY